MSTETKTIRQDNKGPKDISPKPTADPAVLFQKWAMPLRSPMSQLRAFSGGLPALTEGCWEHSHFSGDQDPGHLAQWKNVCLVCRDPGCDSHHNPDSKKKNDWKNDKKENVKIHYNHSRFLFLLVFVAVVVADVVVRHSLLYPRLVPNSLWPTDDHKLLSLCLDLPSTGTISAYPRAQFRLCLNPELSASNQAPALAPFHILHQRPYLSHSHF